MKFFESFRSIPYGQIKNIHGTVILANHKDEPITT